MKQKLIITDDSFFNCKIFETQLIINIYSPTKDIPSGQEDLYKYLYEMIKAYGDNNIIIEVTLKRI